MGVGLGDCGQVGLLVRIDLQLVIHSLQRAHLPPCDRPNLQRVDIIVVSDIRVAQLRQLSAPLPSEPATSHSRVSYHLVCLCGQSGELRVRAKPMVHHPLLDRGCHTARGRSRLQELAETLYGYLVPHHSTAHLGRHHPRRVVGQIVMLLCLPQPLLLHIYSFLVPPLYTGLPPPCCHLPLVVLQYLIDRSVVGLLPMQVIGLTNSVIHTHDLLWVGDPHRPQLINQLLVDPCLDCVRLHLVLRTARLRQPRGRSRGRLASRSRPCRHLRGRRHRRSLAPRRGRCRRRRSYSCRRLEPPYSRLRRRY